MYSVDAYVKYDGQVFCLPPVKVVTAHSVGLPGFYAHESRLPSSLSARDEAAAFSTAKAAIRALNLRSTTTHTEMYHTAEGWKVIEIAARIGGYREILYREVYGITHFHNDLLIREGEEPIIANKPLGQAAALKFYAEYEGTIAAINGIEQSRNLPSMIHIAAHASPGDEAIFSTNGGDLIVDAILSNADEQQLEADIKAVRELVSIEVQ